MVAHKDGYAEGEGEEEYGVDGENVVLHTRTQGEQEHLNAEELWAVGDNDDDEDDFGDVQSAPASVSNAKAGERGGGERGADYAGAWAFVVVFYALAPVVGSTWSRPEGL